MSYFFKSNTIEELRKLHRMMSDINIRIGTFDHEYNGVKSSAIFDTRNSQGWKLVFLKLLVGDTLEIPIQPVYSFVLDGDAVYRNFRLYFGISGVKGKFSIKEFVEHLRKQVPQKYILNDKCRKTITKYDPIDKDNEGIYPIGTINWQLVHAKNPEMDVKKYHRTLENLEKTRELYPAIYKATKDMDLTIKYGIKPGKKQQY